MSKALDELNRLSEEFSASSEGYGHSLRLDFAELIWAGLDRNGWSQTDLARQAKCSDAAISNLVHGNRNFRIDTIGKVLHALGTKTKVVDGEIVSIPRHTDCVDKLTLHRPDGTTTSCETAYYKSGDHGQETTGKISTITHQTQGIG